ncbi:hypothetical protein GSH06_19660 [Burkholderia pseudomallei]|nr:hypothetical protein [Burkholderia pseudomallei]
MRHACRACGPRVRRTRFCAMRKRGETHGRSLSLNLAHRATDARRARCPHSRHELCTRARAPARERRRCIASRISLITTINFRAVAFRPRLPKHYIDRCNHRSAGTPAA